MIEISRSDFFKTIYNGRLDVNPSISSRFPYTSIWKFRDGRHFGKTIDTLESGAIKTKYYMQKETPP